MPTKKGQKKPRKETKPKYVFKVVKPSATQYKQKATNEDTVLNLIKQQHQQNALQQQQLLTSFISQLAPLSAKKQTSPDFISNGGKPLFFDPSTGERVYSQYKGSSGDIITEYSPEARSGVTTMRSSKEQKLREKYFKTHGEYPPPHEHFGETSTPEPPRKSKIPTRISSGSTTEHEMFTGSPEPQPLFPIKEEKTK